MSLFVAAMMTALWLAPGAHAKTCNRPLPAAPSGLPAPVAVSDSCGWYALRPDGSVTKEHSPERQEGGDWVAKRGGHVVLLHNGRVVWRSHRSFRRGYIESGAVSARSLAFNFYRGRLWVASRYGREHAVARNETPSGWTKQNDLLTIDWSQGFELRVRRSDGRDPLLVARNLKTFAFDDTTGTFVYVDPLDGVLQRTDGHTTVALVAPRSACLGTWRSASSPTGFLTSRLRIGSWSCAATARFSRRVSFPTSRE